MWQLWQMPLEIVPRMENISLKSMGKCTYFPSEIDQIVLISCAIWCTYKKDKGCRGTALNIKVLSQSGPAGWNGLPFTVKRKGCSQRPKRKLSCQIFCNLPRARGIGKGKNIMVETLWLKIPTFWLHEEHISSNLFYSRYIHLQKVFIHQPVWTYRGNRQSSWNH